MRLRSTPASHRAALLKRWKVDGSQTSATQSVVQPIDLAAKARVLKENLWDDIGYRVWYHACRNEEIDIGKHQSHYIARLHHLQDYSAFVCVTRDVAEQVRRILTEIKHSAVVIVANEVRGGLTDPHEAVESVEACARLIDEVLPGIADQIRSYVGAQSKR